MSTVMRSECIVFVYLPGEIEAVPAGLLTIKQAGREAASTFVYGSAYRRRPNAVSLDPVEMPLPDRDGQELRPQRGNPLFGVVRDSSPDAWGRIVINDRFVRNGKIHMVNRFGLIAACYRIQVLKNSVTEEGRYRSY